MTAPDAGYTPDPATCVDQNIVRQVAGPLCRSGVHHSQLDFADVPCAMCVELAEFAVVALVGRLLPTDAVETWRHDWPLFGDTRGIGRRRVLTWPDGSTWVGPWLPAPTNSDKITEEN